MVRKATTVMTALGIGLTVAVLLGIGALVDGLTGALAATGHARNLILMRQGAPSELVSAAPREKFDVVKFLPGIEKLDGEPMVSHEVVSVTNLALRSDPQSVSNITVRGLSPMGIKLRDDARLVSGRWFEPGKREVVVGSGAHAVRARNLDRRCDSLRPRRLAGRRRLQCRPLGLQQRDLGRRQLRHGGPGPRQQPQRHPRAGRRRRCRAGVDEPCRRRSTAVARSQSRARLLRRADGLCGAGALPGHIRCGDHGYRQLLCGNEHDVHRRRAPGRGRSASCRCSGFPAAASCSRF